MPIHLAATVGPNADPRASTVAVTVLLALAAALCGAAANVAHAKTIEEMHGFEPRFVLPPNAGMVNIRDFGAKGDGVTDDTHAFKAAFHGNRPRAIYIPNGIYLISDQLRYGLDAPKKKKVMLMGESRTGTIIRLADNTPGFEDHDNPKAFIHTRHPKEFGEQNMHNYIYHLTIEIGTGNPGAIALNYHSNNTGAIKDVTLRAVDPENHPGHTGLGLLDWEVGPANARYLTVEGFQTGVHFKKAANYFTIEHLTVRHCDVGVDAGTTSIRDADFEACRRPVVSHGQTVLLDITIDGAGEAAIDNPSGGLLARRIVTRGYRQAIRSESEAGSVNEPDVDLYVSETPKSLGWTRSSEGVISLTLPIEVSPEIQYPQSPEGWAVMPAKGDISRAIQAAIDRGVEHIYIPATYEARIGSTVILRNRVKRVMGVGNAYLKRQTGERPAFQLRDGEAETVIVELIYSNYGSNASFSFEQAHPRTWVIRHLSGNYRSLESAAGGRVFMESVVNDNATMHFRDVDAWIRDLNTEGGGDDYIDVINEGGTMWILGHKTEDFSTKIQTVRGKTELLGGTYRQNWDQKDFDRRGIDTNDRPPLFESIDSDFSATYVSWGPNKAYTVLVRETQGGETRTLTREEHGGRAVLYVGNVGLPDAPGS